MSRQLQGELDSALTATLEDMQQAVTQLLHTLETEREALVANDSEALNQAGTRKQALMQQLEQLDAERRQLAHEHPAGATRLQPAWTQILQSLRQCQQLNLRNGSTVGQRLNQVREALSILTGHAGENGLYGPGGELRGSLRSQALAQA